MLSANYVVVCCLFTVFIIYICCTYKYVVVFCMFVMLTVILLTFYYPLNQQEDFQEMKIRTEEGGHAYLQKSDYQHT